MGINGLLPRILPSAGRENYDLRALSDGLITLTSPSSTSAHHNNHDDGAGGDADSQSTNNSEPAAKKRKRWTRRKVRIAVDVNGWIARAAHGYGGSLMDERHLSYHGRAELRNEQHLQQQQHQQPEEDKEEEQENPAATNNNNNNNNEQIQIQNKQRVEYISKCISFVLQRIEFLRNECCALVLPVLDGTTPPCKRGAVRERSNRRKRAMEQRDEVAQSPPRPAAAAAAAETTTTAMEANNANNTEQEGEDDEAARTEAEVLRRISASKRAGTGKDYSMRRELLGELLKEFRKRSWPFVVAPYEADGQLAYLANTGAVDLVVTEDSDLIALGVPTLIYRLGGWNGSNAANRSGGGSNNFGSVQSTSSGNHLRGTMLHRRDLGSSHGINLLDFSDAMLATMFVAAGCDYCDSLKGIGIVTARNIVKRAFHGGEADEVAMCGSSLIREEPVLKVILNELFRSCHRDAREQVLPLDDPEKEEVRLAYERSFLAAIAMFRHPLVYDPVSGVHMIANDVCDGSTPVSISFRRDERILMQYGPYRDLVTRKEMLYKVIGAPFAPDTAKGIAEG
ncbi:hypothetical protein ACHAXR_002540, partial [Thalassiosira sp. AJA248-18]